MKAPQNDETPLEQKDKGELLKYIAGLDALLSTNYIISASFDLQTTFAVLANQARQFLQASHCNIYLIDKNKKDIHLAYTTHVTFPKVRFKMEEDAGIIAHIGLKGRPINLSSLDDEERYFPSHDNPHNLELTSLLAVPLHAQNEIRGVVVLVNKIPENANFSREDAQLFESYARQIGLAVKNLEQLKLEVEQKRFEQEIEFCAKIQRRILPKQVPYLPEYGVSGSTFPCRKVGGDWFDFIERDDGTVDFVIADVSGKGIAAALIVAMAHGVIRVLAEKSLNVVDTVKRLNQYIHDHVEFGQFITLFYGRLNPATNHFEYVNAGHDAPWLLEKNSSEVIKLENTGKIIGIDRDAEYESKSIHFSKGSLLIMYTDGYLETTNSKNEFFGNVFMDVVGPLRSLSKVREIRRHINRELMNFRHEKELKDDATMLLINRPL